MTLAHLVCLAVVCFAACGTPQMQPHPSGPPSSSGAAHFFDPGGTPIASYEFAWPILQDFFGSTLPSSVVVEHREEGTSRFDPEREVILISRATTKAQSELSVVAHETAHLGLARLTNGASATEPCRFLDEGLATIIQKRVEGALATYRPRALAFAAGRLTTGSVKLVDLQNWSSYFGVPPNADFDAYDVGAAFVFYVEDSYGPQKLKVFFADLGRMQSLAASLERVLGSSLDATEAAWESYLRHVEVRVPSVAEMFPPNGASGVATDTHEVHAKFDTDMAPNVCVKTDCHDGLCYDHARWTDARTLTVEIEGALLPNHPYNLSLGVPGRCRLKSQRGVEAPIIAWTFSTR